MQNSLITLCRETPISENLQGLQKTALFPSLPDITLNHLVSHLSLEEFNTVSKVCKAWREATAILISLTVLKGDHILRRIPLKEPYSFVDKSREVIFDKKYPDFPKYLFLLGFNLNLANEMQSRCMKTLSAQAFFKDGKQGKERYVNAIDNNFFFQNESISYMNTFHLIISEFGTENHSFNVDKACGYNIEKLEVDTLQYLGGVLSSTDDPRMMIYYEKGAARGSKLCQYYLENILKQSDDGKDYKKTMGILEQLREPSLTDLATLCIYYACGIGVEADPLKAAEYFSKLHKGVIWKSDYYHLRECYQHGYGTEQNLVEALSYFPLNSDYEEYDDLARIYEQMSDQTYIQLLVEANKDESELVTALKQIFHKFPDDKYLEGYPEPVEVNADLTKSYLTKNDRILKCYKLAALKGGCLNSNFKVCCLTKIEDLQKMCFDELADFEKNKSTGFGERYANLAWCYAKGLGTSQDTKKANEMLKKAAEAGHPAAQFYFCIVGEKSSEYFECLSNPNHPWKQKQIEERYWMMAECYSKGLGTSPNMDLAQKYYDLAKSLHFTRKIELLDIFG